MSGVALVDHLWQSTLCVGAAAILAWILRGAGAHVRYGIWLAASLKFLVPFSVFVALGSQVGWAAADREVGAYIGAARAIAAPASTWSAAAAAAAPSSDAASQMITYGPSRGSEADSVSGGALSKWLLIAWAAGAGALAVRWLVRWNSARLLVHSATPASLGPASRSPRATPAELNSAQQTLGARVTSLAASLGSRTPALRIRTTPLRVEPGVFGIFRPTLLLPEDILNSLQPAHLRALVAHETAHVKRRDNLTAALHSLTEILFWFHPLVWWIGARLVAERERACDEAVVRAGNDRETYARAILDVCRLYLGAPIVSASGASRGHLQTRIEAIMNAPVSLPVGGVKRCLLAAAAAIAIAGPIALGITHPVRVEPAVAQAEPVVDSLAAPTLKFAATQILRGEDSKPTEIRAERDTFVALNATMHDLVRFAYGRALPPQVSGGPAWLGTERYTIRASVDPAAVTNDPAAISERVRSLLADRFHFRAHVAKGPVYVLESADSAPEASQKPIEKGIGVIDQKSGKVSFRGASSASVAEALSTFLSSAVLDHTRPGVTYDFKMKWPRNDLKALGDQLHDQAGLTLRSFTMEQLVIDGAARPALDDAAPPAGQIASR